MTEATTAPATSDRHWLAAPPADWNGWVQLVNEVNASRVARERHADGGRRDDALHERVTDPHRVGDGS